MEEDQNPKKQKQSGKAPKKVSTHTEGVKELAAGFVARARVGIYEERKKKENSSSSEGDESKPPATRTLSEIAKRHEAQVAEKEAMHGAKRLEADESSHSESDRGDEESDEEEESQGETIPARTHPFDGKSLKPGQSIGKQGKQPPAPSGSSDSESSEGEGE